MRGFPPASSTKCLRRGGADAPVVFNPADGMPGGKPCASNVEYLLRNRDCTGAPNFRGSGDRVKNTVWSQKNACPCRSRSRLVASNKESFRYERSPVSASLLASEVGKIQGCVASNQWRGHGAMPVEDAIVWAADGPLDLSSRVRESSS